MKIVNLIQFVLLVFSCTNNVEEAQREIPEVLSEELSEEALEHQALFDLLMKKDSLLFQIGFNQIDTSQVAALTSKEFEFYHDEHGITETREAFINSIEGIRDLPFKTWRILVEGSMEVFPLYQDNREVLYGAIQNGVHDFYQQEEGKEAQKTNTARFTHVWILEEGEWHLRRVLSYDHQVPE